MSMSLDGFIAGPNVSYQNGLGDGGERLHDWIFPAGHTGGMPVGTGLAGANRQVFDEFMSTGAVVAGRGTFEPGPRTGRSCMALASRSGRFPTGCSTRSRYI